MNLFAEIVLEPGGIAAWLLVGLIAGWLAGVFMKGSGYGVLGDIGVGLVGALVGGLVCGLFVADYVGFWGSVFIAFIGACLSIAVVRLFAGRGRPVV
jgi:uncharacterized membrane protein YeaQ/YmgE (transglycosylase-associated protein family)